MSVLIHTQEEEDGRQNIECDNAAKYDRTISRVDYSLCRHNSDQLPGVRISMHFVILVQIDDLFIQLLLFLPQLLRLSL